MWGAAGRRPGIGQTAGEGHFANEHKVIGVTTHSLDRRVLQYLFSADTSRTLSLVNQSWKMNGSSTLGAAAARRIAVRTKAADAVEGDV